jgi:hypothetical protein
MLNKVRLSCSQRQRLNVFSPMWKIDPKDKQIHKYKIIHMYKCWEPWATIWQGQKLQVHHISHWGFRETWSGSLCLEKRNINLKIFIYERPGTGQHALGNQAWDLCMWNKEKLGETRRVQVFFMKPGSFEARTLFSGRGHCFPGTEILLAVYNFQLCTTYKLNAKIKNLPVWSSAFWS